MTKLPTLRNSEYQAPSRLAARMLIVALAYFACGRMGLAIPYFGSHITLFWLPTGIAVAALIRWGYICWPGIFLGALATNLSIDSLPLLDASTALGNTLGPLLAAWFLRRMKFNGGFDRASDFLLLAVAATIGMLVNASGRVISLVIFKVLPIQDAGSAWLSWWVGDTFGVLLAAPLLLNISRAEWAKLWSQRVEFLAWCVTVLTIFEWIFLFSNATGSEGSTMAFLVVPAVVWSAMRFELIGSSLGLLLTVLTAILTTHLGLGPFYTANVGQGLLLLWLFLATLVLVNLMVVGLKAGRRRAEELSKESEQYLRTIIESEPECVTVLAEDGTVVQMNPSGFQMLGVDTPEQIVGQKALGIVAPLHRDAFIALMRKVFEGEADHLVFEAVGLKGKHCWLETHAVPMRDTQGKITAMLGITRDITEHKQADAELRIAAAAFESQESVIITNADGVILRVNRAFTRNTGYSSEDVMGQTPRLLKSGRHDANFYREMWEEIKRNGTWQGEIWDRRKNGEVYPKLLTISSVKGKDGVVTNYVGTHIDITERKAAEEKIRQLAFHDPLTQLPNRQLLLDRLNHALASSARSGRKGALLFIDLDNFKTLNDTLGHVMGDLLLQKVAERLTACVREGDTVARLGGDEFVVMLEDLGEQAIEAAEQVEGVGEKILVTLSSPYQLVAHEFRITASIGATLLNNHQQGTEELLKQADIAMYQAKKAGRNAVRFFDPRMQEAINARAALEGELHKAVENRQFQLYYHIQVDNSLHPLGAEALIRWIHPERGVVSPDQFISLAEETGLILPIGLWLLDTAMAQLKAWERDEQTRNLELAVNISARQFRDAGFAAQVRAAVQRHAINPTLLKLELTESMLLEDIEDTVATMSALKAIGVQLSLDDFGTGYSSLQYLKRLPLNQIKIDRTFVRDIATDPNDAAIVQTIIAMAATLDLHVIAEGVETESQREFLNIRGCHAYQGYLFGKPMPIEQFEASLRQG